MTEANLDSLYSEIAFRISSVVACDYASRFVSLVLAVERSEEHTSELQSRLHLVCRLLLEKKKKPVIVTKSTSLTTDSPYLKSTGLHAPRRATSSAFHSQTDCRPRHASRPGTSMLLAAAHP